MRWKTLLGLSFIVGVYLVLGGVGFHFLESGHEEKTRQGSGEYMRRFLDEKQCMTAEELQQLVEYVIEVHDSGVRPTNTTTPPNWDIFSSIFFSATVITTIGYGNIAPTTAGGRIFFVFYAIFGIPLCLILLAGWGDRLTKATEKLDKKLNKNRCPHKPAVGKACRTIFIILLGLILFFGIPAVIFRRIEGWSYGSSLYYTFVTLTTIGFGDFVPALTTGGGARWVYRISVGIWIFIGLAWLATVISLLQDLFENFLQKASTIAKRKSKEEKNEKNGLKNSKLSLHDPESFQQQKDAESSTPSKKNLDEMLSVNL